ncbi:MAG: alkaline phosphatase [Planctomycetes bacterium]|nr:alkaline phosphatase [Planctomycetota bacterium]
MTVRVSESTDQNAGMKTASSQTKKADDYTAVVEVTGLKPDTQYTYDVLLNDEPVTLRSAASLRTFPRPGSESEFALAFGGGAGYTPWFEHMWTTIAEARPLAMIALGDNVYIDTPDVPQTQRYCYYRRQSRPEYRAFAAATPIFAVWDDHDFAGNDCCNGPTFEDPPWKKDVLKVFTENFVNPVYGGGDKTPGIWFDFQIADVDFFMLDTRMYRDFRDTTPRSMLGPVQKQWLKHRLKNSRATFKVIASSLPWAMGAKKGSRDPWSGFPDEREELFQFIEQNRINGVVLISADRHRSDAWKIPREAGYDFYEFMSSKMTNVVKHGLMKGALFGYNEKCSYGRLTFDTKAPDPTVTYTIVNIDGEEIHSLTVKKSQLMHQE